MPNLLDTKKYMKVKIEKVPEIGFCFGVRRAIDTLEKAAHDRGKVDSLGAVVHNEQVLKQLGYIGVRVIETPEDIQNSVVAISSHGVSPKIEAVLKAKNVEIIDTTCSFVRRAQLAAKELADAGFFVVIYGDEKHPEVKGILGWAHENGLATLDAGAYKSLMEKHRKVGILAQTTQIPENFIHFVKQLIDIILTRDTEIRIIDTICHGIRRRQAASLKLANKSDLMLVIGGKASANTRRLMDLCAGYTETHLIGKAEEIEKSWLDNKKHIGVTSGTSTPQQTIDEIVKRLEDLINRSSNRSG
jgi:4-hydroxy-3-methylbut-2-enyl diphosphate reductase